MRFFLLLVSFLCLPLAAFALNPVASEIRSVRPATDEKTVTVPQGMGWYDARRATRGLRFPPGTYVLEAENDEYWYFRSPRPLEFRVFSDREVKEARSIPGGVMLGKKPLKLVPAAGYIDGERDAEKMMIWKLGRDFLRREGKDWRKSF
ncbi:MAG: hypothetical protein NVV63_09425 [Opitutus sp.]|nr:hypothetical protein [Opitutus sp.]